VEENAAMNVRKLESVKLILRQMVPILELLEVLVPQKNLAGPESVLVPQDFAQIASTNVEEDGPQILVKLLALKKNVPILQVLRLVSVILIVKSVTVFVLVHRQNISFGRM
jgi:hypothetical protein